MKKSLFALAAVTAFAGAAQAQSSVTIYGILDVGYIGGNAKAGTINTTSGAQLNPAETVSFLGQSALTTSRLGFRGSEDLGGGTSAFFTIETGISPNSSTLSAFNNRQALIGLSQKGMGRAMIGTQYTPIHEALAPTSAGQYNNIVGDVIYPQNTGLTNRDGNANGSSIGYTIRTNNMIKLQSENVAGFTGKVFYTLNNKNENQATLSGRATNVDGRDGIQGGTNNFNGYGLGIDYAWKKLYLSANYQSFKTEQPYSSFTNTTPIATSAAGNPQAFGLGTTVVSTGTNTTDNQMYLGGAYDFGVLKAYVQYLDRKVTSNLESSAYAKRTAQQIGVRAPITAKIGVWASVGNGRFNAAGQGEPTVNFNGYQLGTTYALSKRTTMYGIFGASQTSSSTQNLSLSNGTTRATNVYYNANNYAVGVRHTF
jgi:predicted porin